MRYIITRRLASLHRTSCSTGSVLHCPVSPVCSLPTTRQPGPRNPKKTRSYSGQNKSFMNGIRFPFIDNYRLITTPSNTTAFYYNSFISIQPLGRFLAGTRTQSGDLYGSGTLHPGQILRGRLPLLSPPLDVPTFSTRCLHVQRRRWNSSWARNVPTNFV